MMKSGIYSGTRVLQILTTLVIVGIMGYFVHPWVHSHRNVPASLLCLFIVSILAAAWCMITIVSRHRYRASSLITALVDLAFVGAFIASVVLLRDISKANCVSARVPLSVTVGSHSAGSNNGWHLSASKDCALLKTAWSLAIANCILFAVTAWVAFSLYQEYKKGIVVVHHKESRRSGSSDYTRRSSSGHRHHHSHSRSNRSHV